MPDIVAFRLWPPIAIGLPLVAGLAITWLRGDPFGLPPARVPLGLALVAFVVVWNGWCLLLFRRHRTGLLPGQATQAMILEGPYTRSRNPLYLGLLVLHLGIALLVPSVWAVLLWPLALVLVTWGAVRPEERFLRQHFGAAYDEYAGRVRRWI